MKVKSVYNADLANKIVLVRVDYNVPMEENRITDNSRILTSVPGLRYLLEKEVKKIILIAHLGRPLGNVVEELRLGPVVTELESLMGEEIEYIKDDFDKINRKQIEKSLARIICVENIRFDRREKEGDLEFAKHLASWADTFVLEGFSVAHRDQASVTKVAQFLPSYAGKGVIDELNGIDDFTASIRPQFWGVFGGIKLADKMPVIRSLAAKLDGVILGSSIAAAILSKFGFGVGDSVISADSILQIDPFLELLQQQKIRIVFPADLIIGDIVEFSKKSTIEIDFEQVISGELKPFEICSEGEAIFDIGQKSIANFKEITARASSIFWNGPLGYFEKEDFAIGTNELAKAIAHSTASSLVGGGDTVNVIAGLGLTNDFDFVSMAGGAMLEYLASGTLPGLEAIANSGD